MTTDIYNPERDITPAYLAKVDAWIAASGEVLVIMRYLRAAGSKDYALVSTSQDFRVLTDACGDGTDIIVFRDPQLPLRGKVDAEFIGHAKALVPDGHEYLYMRTTPEEEGDPRCWGEMGDAHGCLAEDLGGNVGVYVAFGPCPNFSQPDNDVIISASKGGIDGPR